LNGGRGQPACFLWRSQHAALDAAQNVPDIQRQYDWPCSLEEVMHTEFRKAEPASEMRSLLAFDRKAFLASDRFPADYWRELESYWMLIDGVKVGCCAFEKNVDFHEDGELTRRKGSLYVATTGILPRFRGLGFGTMLKYWEICYARRHRFGRIVTNMRASNTAIIQLNKKLGFKRVRTTAHYYTDPEESTVVMELLLPSQ